MGRVGSGQISVRQAVIALSLTVVGADAFLAPGLAVRFAGQDAVFAYGAAVAVAGLIAGMLSVLGRRHPDQTIVQMAETTWGALVGKLVGVFFLLWLIQANALFIRTMADLTLATGLEETPLGVVLGVLAVVVAVMAVMGLEGIARFAEYAFLLIWAVIFFLWATAAKDLEFHHLLPVLTRGLAPVVRASMPVSAVFGEIVIAGMLLPFLEQSGRVMVIWAAVTFLSLVRMVGGILLETAMFGVAETGRFLAPMLELARTLQVAGLIERVDALLVLVWLFNAFVKMALFLYATVLGLSQLARLSDYRPLVFPVMATTAVLGFGLFRNTVELRAFVARVWGPYALAFELGIPLLLLLGSLMRGKPTSDAPNRRTEVSE